MNDSEKGFTKGEKRPSPPRSTNDTTKRALGAAAIKGSKGDKR